jgi:hypothetical protein
MNKVEKQQLVIARERKKEIARKVQAQRLQASGYVRSQLSGLTSMERLIECDHYMRTGQDLARSNARDEVEKAEKRLQAARPTCHKHRKVQNGIVVGVNKVYTDK